ncbi:MAG: trehalose-6-phosphate synthase [Deltaproteobacteria bacterium]|nr:trehalose-6-phosphate synthase [Deltaproteobacteria bacterium]
MNTNLTKKISLQSLRLTFRFILPLVAALALLAFAIVPVVEKLIFYWFIRDMDVQSKFITGTIQEPIVELLQKGNATKINSLLMNAIKEERLYALGYCNREGKLVYRTKNFPRHLGCKLPGSDAGKPQSLLHLPQGPVHVAINSVEQYGNPAGSLVILQDMSFVERRSDDTKKYVVALFVVIAVVISVITVFIAHISWRGWMDGMRALLRGEGLIRPFSQPTTSELQPLVGDLRTLLRTFETERRFADDVTVSWTPEALRDLLRKQLAGERILVVSNREPYIHRRGKAGIEVNRPASGLVTAIEPVMRACSGIWIAHGSGSADRETVDRNDLVPVPPDHPEYTLRRIWLTKEEEIGYYYGFANEGLWPLCHIAHVRPIFRSNDWKHYVEINRRFAEAVVRESSTDDPVVLVQDYHFALLPKMIRKALPKATVITFWHIPWPNPESFGICPWREELLLGMLGSTILGFHTRLHCNNFLATVDRYLETRIEYESSTIHNRGKLTLVESYPISIQWPSPLHQKLPPPEVCRAEVQRSHGFDEEMMIGVGVDRLDYTKGILERLRAVERLLEIHPEMIGRFTFIQIAAPSRSSLEDYQSLDNQVRALATRINERFSTYSYQPICLKLEHHEPEVVNSYYRAADVCMVTSLHDGMNLVAKEFVAAREDEQGVLVLSQFTGAAQELHEALIVNPYHIEQTADALYRALTMPDYEQKERMRSMRSLVRDFNVYRWAGRMLIDASRIRQREKLAGRIGERYEG